MPEPATGGVLRKKVFFKMSQNSEETPVPEETPVNFAKFLTTPFLQSNSGRLLLKCRHCNNEVRGIDCSVVTESIIRRCVNAEKSISLKTSPKTQQTENPNLLVDFPTN